jgi:hypothetical protein
MRAKFIRLALLLLCIGATPVWAQTTATVNSEINVDFGELSIRNAAGSIDFGDRFPGDQSVRPLAGSVQFLLTDSRAGATTPSYHVTVQATTDFIDGANTFSANNLVVNGAAVSVTADAGNTNPAPAIVAVPNQDIRTQARRVLQADQGTVATTGTGRWIVAVDGTGAVQDNWRLTIPVGTPNGLYTATVTFTVVPGL